MTTLALSIQQPWAALIVHGIKPVENRTWLTRHRGPVLIHASKAVDDAAIRAIERGLHPVTGRPWQAPVLAMQFGGIVGQADIVDCVQRHGSEWFTGPWGFVLARARGLPFVPCRGMLGLFDPGLAAQGAVAAPHDATQKELF